MGILQWLSRPEVAEPLRQPAPRADIDLLDPQAIAEYRAVAQEVGMPAEMLDVEEFRLFLDKRDLPLFNRAEVIAYMDHIAAEQNPMILGWLGCPVRATDVCQVTFGEPSEWNERIVQQQGQTRSTISKVPASDYYSPSTKPYTRVMPMHALKKIALIEKDFGKRVKFLVSDYVLVPHIMSKTMVLPPSPRINPDPFLMAIVPNAVSHGNGYFVIDVWDEPGFGLRMLK